MPMRRVALFLIVALVTPLLLAACGGGSSGGLPSQPGQYGVKEKSVSFNGEKYSFFWLDGAGNLHRAQTRDVKLKLGDKNQLEIAANREAILHLKQDEPVTVEGRDRQGDFGNFWYPFLIGSMLSRGGSGPVIINNPPADYRDPVYRYPPTDRFDRGDTISGNVASTKPGTPDYSRLPQTSGTVAGQSGGTGGGNAATNKADASAAASGQSGGTGGGSAALNKSGSFKTGSQGFDSKVDAGSVSSVTGRTGSLGAGDSKPSVSTGKAPSIKAPKISTGRRR
jgi:hypothetical protein